MGGLGTLIGGVIGFGAALIPEFMSIIRAAYFHRFSMEACEKGHQELAAQMSVQSDTINNLAAQIQQSRPESLGWVEALRVSLRPIITYLFFGMFFIIKLTMLWYAMHYAESVKDITPIVWDTETSSLFAAVISFWFGSRALGAATGTATVSTPSRVPGLVNGDTK